MKLEVVSTVCQEIGQKRPGEPEGRGQRGIIPYGLWEEKRRQ
jgi:hypothetical protein